MLPRTHYSLVHKVYLYLKDVYGLGFAYTVSIHFRLKISFIVCTYIEMMFLFIYRENVGKGLLVYIKAKWVMKC